MTISENNGKITSNPQITKRNSFPANIERDSHISFQARPYSFVPPNGVKGDGGELSLVLGKKTWTCCLYPPAGIVDSMNSKWNVEGVLSSVASGNMSALGSALKKIGNAKGFGETVDAIIDAAQPAAIVVGDSLIGKAADLAGNTLLNSWNAMNGSSFAPNEMAVYKGAGNKQVTFVFEMIPSSAEEALQIRQIVNRFKILSSGFYDGSGLWGAVSSLKAPSLFDIEVRPKNFAEKRSGKVMYSETTSDSLIRYGSMACTEFSASYGGGAQTALFHNDGSPLATTLSLTFQSIRPIHRNSVDMGIPEEDGFGAGGI